MGDVGGQNLIGTLLKMERSTGFSSLIIVGPLSVQWSN